METIKICIIEDHEQEKEQLLTILKKYEKKNTIAFLIDCITETDSYLYLNNDYNLYFIDIYLKLSNGIEIAKSIRKQKETPIVFVTNSDEFAIEAYEIEALHYIIKPISYREVEQVMTRYFKISGMPRNGKLIELKLGRDLVEVNETAIQYIEKENKELIVHTAHYDFRTYGTLNSMLEQFSPNHFFRPQRGYIVNYDFVEQITRTHIVLKNKIEISIGRNCRTKVLNEYYEHVLASVWKK